MRKGLSFLKKSLSNKPGLNTLTGVALGFLLLWVQAQLFRAMCSGYEISIASTCNDLFKDWFTGKVLITFVYVLPVYWIAGFVFEIKNPNKRFYSFGITFISCIIMFGINIIITTVGIATTGEFFISIREWTTGQEEYVIFPMMALTSMALIYSQWEGKDES